MARHELNRVSVNNAVTNRTEQNRTNGRSNAIDGIEQIRREKHTFFIEESCIYKGFAVRLQKHFHVIVSF